MKKVLFSAALLIIIYSILFSFEAYRNTKDSSDSVLIIKNDQYGVNSVDKYDICDEVLFEIDESNVGNVKTVSIFGKQYQMKYEKTIKYVVGDYTVDDYILLDPDPILNDNGNILLTQDGELCSILSNLYKIDIDPQADAETVKRAVESALNSYIDFSKYAYCDSIQSVISEDDDSGFISNTIRWYNKIGDAVKDDYISLYVNCDGYISAVNLRYLNIKHLDEIKEDIKIDDYIPKIEKKLADVYKGIKIDFTVKNALLTYVEGEPSVVFGISIKRFDNNGVDYYIESVKMAIKIK